MSQVSSSSCQVYHSADMLKVCCVQNEREGKAESKARMYNQKK